MRKLNVIWAETPSNRFGKLVIRKRNGRINIIPVDLILIAVALVVLLIALLIDIGLIVYLNRK